MSFLKQSLGSPRRRAALRSALAVAITATMVSLSACSPTAGGDTGEAENVLTIAARNNIRGNYDPQESTSGVNFFMTPVFESLVELGEAGEYKPVLATAWEISDDNSVLTLTLREGVTFHNGEVFDANAVKATVERGQTLETSALKPVLADIAEIEVLDDHAVALHIPNGAARLLDDFTREAGLMLPPEGVNEESFRTNPVGTGPWQVSDQSDATSQMLYEAYPDYWDTSVQGVERIEIKILSQQAAQNGFLDGSIDFIEAADRQAALSAESVGAVNLDSSFGMNLYVFQMNKQEGSLFSDERLRLALAYAIDRDELVENVFSELGLNECVPTSQAFQTTSPYYDESLEPISYDPDEAQDLMAEAGYPNGFEFTATASSTFLGFGVSLTAMKQQLEAVGITMNIELQPLTSLTPSWLAGEHEALYQITKNPTQYYGPQSLGPVSDPRWQEALDESFSAPDGESRTAALREWSALFQETASSVTICNQPHSVWVQDNVNDLTYPSIEVINYKGVTVG